MSDRSRTISVDLIGVAFLACVLALLVCLVATQSSFEFDDGFSHIVVRRPIARVGKVAIFSTVLSAAILALRSRGRVRRAIGAILMAVMTWQLLRTRVEIDSYISFANPIMLWMEESWSIRARLDRTFIPAIVMQLGLLGLASRALVSDSRLTTGFNLRDLAVLGLILCVFGALLRAVWVNV